MKLYFQNLNGIGSSMRCALYSTTRLILVSIVIAGTLLLLPGEAAAQKYKSLFSTGTKAARSWSASSNLADHINRVNLAGDWPKMAGCPPPLIKGGGHFFDPNLENSLPNYLWKIASASPDRAGTPKFVLPGGVDASELLRQHFGIDMHNPLATPTDMWAPGVVTRNMHTHSNGVIVLNVPKTLHQTKYYKKLQKLDYQNPLYRGGIPGDRSLFDANMIDELEVSNLLKSLKNDPLSIIDGNSMYGNVCHKSNRYSVQAMGYPSSGWETFFPTINQPVFSPKVQFNQGP